MARPVICMRSDAGVSGRGAWGRGMVMYARFTAKCANERPSFSQTQLIKLTYDINPSSCACIIYIN